MKRNRSGESGQTLVEFVIVIIPMLILLLLAIQYLLIWRADSYLQLATYSAARKYAVSQDENTETAKEVAMMYLDGIVSKDQVTFTFPEGENAPDFGDPFSVKLSMQFPLLGMPLVQQLFAQTRETIEWRSDVRTIDGTEPPTAASLGLGPNYQVEILSSKYKGSTAQEYNYYGRINPHMDYYYPFVVNDHNHLGHNDYDNVFSGWTIPGVKPPSKQEVIDYYKPFMDPQIVAANDCDCGLSERAFPNGVLRVVNPTDTQVFWDGRTAVGTPYSMYEFQYQILKVSYVRHPDPNSITLTAGAVMNKEAGY